MYYLKKKDFKTFDLFVALNIFVYIFGFIMKLVLSVVFFSFFMIFFSQKCFVFNIKLLDV